ncbi:hypothetical protein SY88_04705 [Clostridiales bacterium PH28_bin88]|nr:hypothetical protein SY88_04705 [Clostridiales bacterium PH28_bin88]
MALLLTVIFAALIAAEAPKLVQEKMWRELAVYSTLMLLGMFLSYAQVLRIDIPNPDEWVRHLYKPVSEAVFRYLTGK